MNPQPENLTLESEPAPASVTSKGVGSGPWLGGLEATCEDCMALMARYPDKAFDLAIVDPPYGIGEDGAKNHTRGGLAAPTLSTLDSRTDVSAPLARASGSPSVAALFVQPDGCYSGRPDIDAWPEARDARRYAGPLPVVAHPPCQLWGSMAAVNFARWGGEHNRPGNDGGCFAAALAAVNRWGGVLEHPAASRAWKAHGLTAPRAIGWQRSGEGWVCEVWQSAYGHRANKATWLYYRGANTPHELRWARIVGTHQIGFHDQRGKARNKPTLNKREANATPPEFRDELLRLALLANIRHEPRPTE